MESYFAAAYWGPRQEALEACAKRAYLFLAQLAEIAEIFGGWRQKGYSRAQALRSGALDSCSEEELAQQFLEGRNRKDIGGDVIADLGYRISVWNGGDKATASSLSMKCGLYSTVVGLSNAVVLDLPQRFDFDSQENVCNLLRAFAEAWEPDWAIVTSQSARDSQTGHSPYLDRALYVSTSMPVPPALPPSAIRHQLPGGALYVA